jgi:signal peptidase I
MPITAERRADALRAANRSRRRVALSWGRDWLRVLPAALVLFLVVRAFVVEAYRIPSSSMERTLLVGDFLLVNKLVYGAEVPFTTRRLPAVRAPRRQDIIVFEWPVDRTKSFVKRLIGLPGDTVAMQGGVLLRNGVRQQESYVHHDGTPGNATRDDWGPVVVPPRHFFVLGDNRDNSLDSRFWGFVPDSLLRGAPWIVYYSFTPDSAATVPWLTRIRWQRLGSQVR